MAKPGATITAYVRPFETWASMPQTLWAEDWPDDDRPGTVAYFCGSLDAPWPADRRPRRTISAGTGTWCTPMPPTTSTDNLGLFFPNAVSEQGFAWHLLCGAGGQRGLAALATQHVSVNIDPSDRYVQSVPGSDQCRLRPDESGYDNLVSGGRLDGLRDERRVYRGGGDVRPGGGQRAARPRPLSPDPRVTACPEP